MLCLKISTNVSLEGVDTSSILSEATSTVAVIINNPKSFVKIVLEGSIPKSVISFGGSEASAYVELVSTGNHNPDRNNRLSVAIASLFDRQLSVPTSRFFIKFYETKHEDLLNVLTVFEDVVVNEQHPLQELSIPLRHNTHESPARGEFEIGNESNEELATKSLQHRVAEVSITSRCSTRLWDKPCAPAQLEIENVPNEESTTQSLQHHVAEVSITP
ncbi:uncharacterized protein LOC132167461 [Corylus avellana]|uniref:uncharacterized protein LOC132167461 n=1 Tax=Corylus avellana TaxID=13451 RepID=UPI00286AFC08|nr:uncharacterized protein LOC132167461 [Corylus avellana]